MLAVSLRDRIRNKESYKRTKVPDIAKPKLMGLKRFWSGNLVPEDGTWIDPLQSDLMT